MKSSRFTRFLAGAFATSLLASSFGWAQMSVEKVVALDKTLQHVKASYNKLDSRHQKMLDGYANICLLYTSPSPRDLSTSRMPSSA